MRLLDTKHTELLAQLGQNTKQHDDIKKIYILKIVLKKISTFYSKVSSFNKFVVLPYLATAYYVEAQRDKPANLPEAMAIEDFWGLLKGLVYKHA